MRTLNDLSPGETGVVRGLRNAGPIRRRLMDIGLIAGTSVECVGRSPAGDPAAYLIRGAVIAIRDADGRGILIEGGGDERGSDAQFNGKEKRRFLF